MLEEYRYYQFYKPAGCITALRDEKEPTIMQYLGALDMTRLRPVGRLDRDTEGLLILTDDGGYNQRMTHPDAGIEKEYFFCALGVFDEEKQRYLADGARLRGVQEVTARPAYIKVLDRSTLKQIEPLIKGKTRERVLKNRPDTPAFSGLITVTEGRKHEVKRLLKSIGCCCVCLKRVRMGEVRLFPDLKPGEFREFTPDDR